MTLFGYPIEETDIESTATDVKFSGVDSIPLAISADDSGNVVMRMATPDEIRQSEEPE